MSKDKPEYLELEKTCQGWGSAYGALAVLVLLEQECRRHPKAIVSVHR